MGKGVIISGGTDGLYSVQLKYNRDRLDAMIAALQDKKTKMQDTRAEVQQEWNDLKPIKDQAVSDLNDLIQEMADLYGQLQVWQHQLTALNMEIVELENELSDEDETISLARQNAVAIETEYPDTFEEWEDWQLLQQQITVGESNIDALQNQIDEKKEERDALNEAIKEATEEVELLEPYLAEYEKYTAGIAYDLALIEQRLSAIDLDITAIDKRIALLQDTAPEDETISAWCADLTEDLSGTVGTIEVPGEKQVVQIWPGYDGTDALTVELIELEATVAGIQTAVEEEMVDEEPEEPPEKPPEKREPPERPEKESDPKDPAVAPGGGAGSPPEYKIENPEMEMPSEDPEEIDESEEEPLTGDNNIQGTLRSDTMANLNNITVTVYRKEGTGDDITWSYVTSTQTAADGTYTLTGLTAGTFRIKFSDAAGAYRTSYYNDKTTLDLGTDITVTAAEDLTGIDATLSDAATISGTVTDS